MKKNSLSIIRKISFLIAILFLFNNNAFAQFPACSNCVSNDFVYQQYFIGDASGNPLTGTCTSGTPINAFIWLQVTNNNTRYSLKVKYDFTVTNPNTGLSTTTSIDNCLYEYQAIPNSLINLGPVNWTCGDVMTISNFLMAWKQNNSLGCETWSQATPKCVCLPNAIVNAPLSVNFISGACNNGTTTTVNFTSTATGGVTPYTFLWNFGDGNTSTLQNPTHTYNNPGPYTANLTVTGAENTQGSNSHTLIFPSQLAATTSQTNVTISGGSNGTATINVSGGSPAYTYNWSTVPSQTTATATNLSTGTYTVVATDIYGCTISKTVTITEPTPINAIVSSQTNVNCFGGNTASIDITVTGGVAPYSFNWTKNNIYFASTEDLTGIGNGTYAVTITDANNAIFTLSNIIISQPLSALSSVISNSTNVACFATNTGLATVSATGGTAPYSYIWNTSPVQTTANAINLTTGNYTVIVTDANGCTTNSSVSITEPAEFTATAAGTNVNCNGASNGTANAIVTGGTIPYAYSWNTSPVQTTATAINLSAGNYECTITDAQGCTSSAIVTITQPSSLSASITNTNVSCNNTSTGSATINANGGTTPYSYSWNTNPIQTSTTASNLSAGTYVCTITDGNGCTLSSSVTISQPNALIATPISTNATCFGTATGTATVNTSGGTAPYSYSWNTNPIQSTANANNIVAGSYTCIVTDANNCTISTSITITEPPLLNANVSSVNNVSCYGTNTGSATTIANGGTAPYSYSWNTLPVQTAANATNLSAGNYSCTITDANGCTTSVSVTINQPAAVTASSISANATCFGTATGTATASINGGTAPYSYSWNTNPIQTNANANNLVAGSYVCIITDANGCTVSTSATINQPVDLTANTSSSNATCNGNATGSATITANGGTAPYSYSWNTNPIQATATANNLNAGTYICIVTDVNGCTISSSVTISEPIALNVSSNSTNAICFGTATGSANVSVNGGTTPYIYLWNTNPVQNTSSANNVIAGTYICTITDANGCSISSSVTIIEPSLLTSNISSINNVACNATNTGSATVSANGGTSPYSYSWSTNPAQNDSTAINLTAGNYNVTVTDSNGCSLSSSVTITEPQLLSISSSQTNVTCFQGNNGAAIVNVNGGTAPYNYLWNTNPIQTTASINNLNSGSYSCIITDALGCTSSITITITEPQQITFTQNITICQGTSFTLPNGNNVNVSGTYTNTVISIMGCDSIITTNLNVTNAFEASVNAAICNGASYALPNGNIVTIAGTYIDTVKTNLGCDSIITTSLTVNPVISITLSLTICFGSSYTLPGGSTVSVAGTYVDTLISNKGCDSIVITDLSISNILTSSQNPVLCQGQTFTLPSGIIANVSGTFIDTISTNSGCDSVITTNLVINPTLYSTQNPVICTEGIFVLPSGQVVTKPGTYTDTIFSAITGCDSIITTNLVVLSTALTIVNASICYNSSYTLPSGNTTSTAGIYYDTLATTKGCDSVIITNLNVVAVLTNSVSATICFNSNYILPGGNSVNSAGIYKDTLSANSGCDSIITTTLTILPANSTIQNHSICANSWFTLPNGTNVNTPGTYLDTLTAQNGCDSVIITNLILLPVITSNVNAVIPCPGQSYTLPSGIDVNTAGTYTDTLQSKNGCDSILITTVIINPAPISSFTANVTSGTTPLNVSFLNNSQNATNFDWNFGDGNTSNQTNPSNIFNYSGNYTITLIAYTTSGCADTSQLTINAVDDFDVVIPNVFTPNNDGTNDAFFLNTEGAADLNAEIYDRWGLKMYEWNGVNGGWDGYTLSGQQASDGTYYYIIKITELGGKTHIYKGSFSLIK